MGNRELHSNPPQEPKDTKWMRTFRRRGNFSGSTAAIRFDDGTSRKDFAAKIEITPTTLINFEKGKSENPKRKIVNKIIDISKIDPDGKAAQYYRAQSKDTEPISINEIKQPSYTFGQIVVYTRTLGGLRQEDVRKGFERKSKADIGRLEKDEVGPDIADAAGLINVLDLPENDPLGSVIMLKAERPGEPIADEIIRELPGGKYLVKEYLLSLGGYPLSSVDRELLTRLDERETVLRAQGSTDIVRKLMRLLPPPKKSEGKATNESTGVNDDSDKALEVVKELKARGFDIHHPITHMFLDAIERPDVPKWNEMNTQQQWEALVFSLPKETRVSKSVQYISASLGALSNIEGVSYQALKDTLEGRTTPTINWLNHIINLSPLDNDGLAAQQLRLDRAGIDLYSVHDLPKYASGELIFYARTLIGMTQKDLATQLNTTQRTITSWENGAHPRNLNPDVLIEILGLATDSVFAKVIRASLQEQLITLTPEDIQKAQKEGYLFEEHEARNISFRLPATDIIKIYDIEGTATRVSLEGASNVIGQTLYSQRKRENITYSAMHNNMPDSTYDDIEKGAIPYDNTVAQIAENLGMPLPHPGACLLIDLSAAERAKR